VNRSIATALSGYLETLYYMNQRLILLCGEDIMSDINSGEKLVLDLIQDIPRMIPYSYSAKEKKLVYKNRDGLFEYRKEIPVIDSHYNDILNVNYQFLDKVRKIRNKYEHKMHGIKYRASGGGSGVIFNFTFEVDGEEITVWAHEFISLIKMLNILFGELVESIKQYAIDAGEEDYPYYRKLCGHDYTDFNRIYESELLRTVGRAIKEY
jgi:hypothetical protein